MTNLRSIRERLGVTQSELGAGIGCSQGNVGFYERGEQDIPPARAEALIRFAQEKGHVFTYDDIYRKPEAQPAAAGA